ncbi:preprotein translocase subunit YajC [Gryllotalpicola koreensis]|uniref:Preprotein translocase subunit YajC n=1 Tax=Gryllotalpicola koreensis TaxID=993086 RepID=A0ABP7ZX32_9MICO
MGNNPTLIVLMVVIIGFFFFWTWRNNRKRQRDEAEKSSQLVKGVEIMTNSGIFGTIESVDLENNKVVLETSPGQFLTVHRQAISRIETPLPASDDSDTAESSTAASSSAIDQANAEAQAQAAKAADQKPEFGERIPPTKSDD